MTIFSSSATQAANDRRRLITVRPWQRQWLWWMTYLCIGSGIGIWIVKYAIEQDPFSMWNHPSQPWLIAVHEITSPILIFVIGSLMIFHVIPHFRERDHFWSGNLALATFAVYSVTGMFLFFPSGLVLYWLTSNILSIAQQAIINRINVPEPAEADAA